MNRSLARPSILLIVMALCTYHLVGTFWTATLPMDAPQTPITHRTNGKNARAYITVGGSDYYCYGSPKMRIGEMASYDASVPNRCRASDELWALTRMEKVLGIIWVLLGLVLGYLGFDLFMDAGRRDDRGRAHARVGPTSRRRPE